jgi:hypothetical protein
MSEEYGAIDDPRGEEPAKRGRLEPCRPSTIFIAQTPYAIALPRKRERKEHVSYTTVLCRSMQVCSTSSIGLLHQCSEKISISE